MKILILLIFVVFGFTFAGADMDYSNYDYPESIPTEKVTDAGDWFDKSDDKTRLLTPEERHDMFLDSCGFRVDSDSIFLDPKCVEIIIDAKLEPIHDKLDYLITEKELVSDESFDDWLMGQYP